MFGSVEIDALCIFLLLCFVLVDPFFAFRNFWLGMRERKSLLRLFFCCCLRMLPCPDPLNLDLRAAVGRKVAISERVQGTQMWFNSEWQPCKPASIKSRLDFLSHSIAMLDCVRRPVSLEYKRIRLALLHSSHTSMAREIKRDQLE